MLSRKISSNLSTTQIFAAIVAIRQTIVHLYKIFDELQEVTYLKRYYNYFDSEVSKFVLSDLIRQEIEEKFNDSLMKLFVDDKYYDIKLSTLNTEKNKCLEAADNFDKKINRQKKNYIIIQKGYKDSKIKSLIDFDEEYISSVKSLAIKKETKINLTIRFLNGKMLMFCKTSIQSFVYDLIDIFMFPDEIVKDIYEKYEVIKCFYIKT